MQNIMASAIFVFSGVSLRSMTSNRFFWLIKDSSNEVIRRVGGSWAHDLLRERRRFSSFSSSDEKSSSGMPCENGFMGGGRHIEPPAM